MRQGRVTFVVCSATRTTSCRGVFLEHPQQGTPRVVKLSYVVVHNIIFTRRRSRTSAKEELFQCVVGAEEAETTSLLLALIRYWLKRNDRGHDVS